MRYSCPIPDEALAGAQRLVKIGARSIGALIHRLITGLVLDGPMVRVARSMEGPITGPLDDPITP